jgi:hypothetical protein
MAKISSMLCGFCELAPGNTDPPSKRPSVAILTELVKYLQKKSVKSDRNVLVVYTNSNGNVLQPPTIGGRGSGDKLLPLPQPPVRARTDARTNSSAQRATQLRRVLVRVYAVSIQNQITTNVP